MNDSLVKTSKFLSLVLRHHPEKAGLTLDESGWCFIPDLLKGCKITREELDSIVANNDKKRFEIVFNYIRAVQGHSIEVDLKYEPTVPPDILYHGTAIQFLDSIYKKGLIKGKRQHVHLTDNLETAFKTGARHGRAVVIALDAKTMHAAGVLFYRAPNGVWLVDAVPPQWCYTFYQKVVLENPIEWIAVDFTLSKKD